MEHILITGATTAKAQQIARNYDKEMVWLADYSPIPEVLQRSGRYIQLSAPDNDRYIHELLKACLDVDARHLHLSRPEEVALLSSQLALFEEYGIEVSSHC